MTSDLFQDIQSDHSRGDNPSISTQAANQQDFSISEFLTKLATGESSSNANADQAYYPGDSESQQDPDWWNQQEQGQWTADGDPPPVTEWPAPRPDPWSTEGPSTSSNGAEEWQEPVPEWQIQVGDEEPPEVGYLPGNHNGKEEAYTGKRCTGQVAAKTGTVR